MLFSNSHSYENLIKNDNLKTSEFLMAFADHLTSSGQINQKDGDDLRLELNSFNLMNARDPIFLNHYLLEKQNDLLTLLQTRYGALGLYYNMSNYCLRPIISKLAEVLAEMSGSLVETARLHFNRFFYIYHNDICETRTLLSDFLLAKAAGVAGLYERLRDCIPKTEAFTRHQMVLNSQNDESFDQEIAASLGFTKFVSLDEAGEQSTLCRLDIFSAITLLGESLGEMLYQISRNLYTAPKHIAEIEVLLQFAQSEVHRLISVKDMYSRDFNALEQKRLNYSIILFTLIDITNHIKENLGCLCRQFSQFKHPQAQNSLPQSLKRRMSMQIFSKQVNIRKAQTAASELEKYCQNNNILPNAIIPGELSKISPHLNTDTLNTLSEYSKSDTVSDIYSTLKAENLEAMKKISEKLSKSFPKNP